MCPTISAWWAENRPVKRLLELRDLLAQLAPGQIGQHLGITGAGEQRLKHGAARNTQHLGGHAGELHARVLEAPYANG